MRLVVFPEPMNSPKRMNSNSGKTHSSFMEFQSKTDDAWDAGDDEWMTPVVSMKGEFPTSFRSFYSISKFLSAASHCQL